MMGLPTNRTKNESVIERLIQDKYAIEKGLR